MTRRTQRGQTGRRSARGTPEPQFAGRRRRPRRLRGGVPVPALSGPAVRAAVSRQTRAGGWASGLGARARGAAGAHRPPRTPLACPHAARTAPAHAHTETPPPAGRRRTPRETPPAPPGEAGRPRGIHQSMAGVRIRVLAWPIVSARRGREGGAGAGARRPGDARPPRPANGRAGRI